MKRLAMMVGIALAMAATSALAANGDLDLAFGNSNGVALSGTTGVSNTFLSAPVVQPDGKILVCNGVANGTSGNDFLIVRFNPDGSLDDTFSFDGRATVDFDGGSGGEGDQCSGVALQSDGKIVMAGYTHPTTTDGADFAVARLNSDGTLDTSFGSGTGKTTIGFDLNGGIGDDVAADLVLQPDGKIVVVGTVATSANGTDFGIVRLQTDGSRDPAFNLTGKVTFGFDLAASTTRNDTVAAVALDDAGRIVIAGSADNGPNSFDFAIARVLPNGQLDADFHSNGRTTVGFDLGMSKTDQLFGLALQRDGRIVVVGDADVSASSTPNTDMAIARLQPDGSLDSSFGINGKTLASFDATANGGDIALGITEQANGKLLIVGAAVGSAPLILGAAVRLNPDGEPDDGFGTLGKHTYDFGVTTPSSGLLRGLTVKGGHVIASGLLNTDFSTSAVDMFLVRLEDDDIFASGFD